MSLPCSSGHPISSLSTRSLSIHSGNMAELPVDVIFSIIEDIGTRLEPDFDLLWAFCSTCRTLRRHAQKFLFRSLNLKFTKSAPLPYGTTMSIFWKHMKFILNGNPHLATAVTYLQFRTVSPKKISQSFVSFLSKLTKLKTLRCGYTEGVQEYWDLLEESQKRAWESILRLPSVEKLQILRFSGIPISVLFP